MFNLVPEHKRLDLMPKYLVHPILFMRFEDNVYDFAHQLLESQYSGGYWDFYDNNKTFFFAPTGKEEYRISSPNHSEGVLTRIETGMVITCFALSQLSFYAYQKNIPTERIGVLYHNLLDEFESCENAALMFRLID